MLTWNTAHISREPGNFLFKDTYMYVYSCLAYMTVGGPDYSILISPEWMILEVRRWQFHIEYTWYICQLRDPTTHISREWMILGVRRWQFPYWIHLEYMSVGGPDYSYLPSEWYFGKKVAIPKLNILGIYVSWGTRLLISPVGRLPSEWYLG